MDSFAYLYIALAAAAAALAAIAVRSRGRAVWKAASVGLLCVIVVIGYFSFSALLSKPKRLSADMAEVADARVLSAALEEDEAIYLWLSIDETPRFYMLPWDKTVAQGLQSVMRETRLSGHDVVVRRTQEQEAEDMEGGAGANRFYAVPPPTLLPEKRLIGIRGAEGVL